MDREETSLAEDSPTGWSAVEIARRVARGDVSAEEVTRAYVARVVAVNPALNAVVVPLFDSALAEARQVDRARATGGILGPLAGVPVTVKECIDIAGTPSTLGLVPRARERRSRDAAVVTRLRAAGAVIVGKTNASQLLMFPETDNPVYGRTANPWALDRSCGGSSGGEGAIVAAGGSALGIGTDIGGSVRIPASFCGIAALKTTARWLPLEGTGEVLPWLIAIPDTVGPLARSVADLELALRVLARPAEGERPSLTASPVEPRDGSAVVPSRLRVGFYEEDGYFPVSAALRRAVREARDVLAAEGAELVPFVPPRIAEIMDVAHALFAADGGRSLAKRLRGSPVDPRNQPYVQLSRVPLRALPPSARVLRIAGQARMAGVLATPIPRTAADHTDLVERAAELRRDYLDALESRRIDALLGHPYPLPALPHGASARLSPVQSGTMAFNFLGWPAGVVSVTTVRPEEEASRPESRDLVERTARACDRGSAGLPVAVQIAARPWREDVVLALLRVIERAFAPTMPRPTAV